MKKRITFLVTTILLIFLVSCGDNTAPPSETDTYTDNYLYTQINGVLYRISTVTASVTPVCPDPLCEHNDSYCPFFGVENISMAGRYIYYLKGISFLGGYEKLCRFDLKSGEYEVIYNPENATLNDLCVNDEYAFFNSVFIDEDYEATYHIMRYDAEAREVTRLSDEELSFAPTALLIEGERVYWHGEGNNFYSTDLHFQNKKENDRGYSPSLTMGNYSFRLENANSIIGYDGYKTGALKLTRIDNETGEEIVIFEEIGSYPIMYNGMLIYQKLDELRYVGDVYDEETGSWRPYYDKYGGKYYICNSDGSDERLLCDFSDTNYVSQISHNILGGKRGVDDWIAVWVQTYVSADVNDAGKVKRGDNTYLLINVITGEVKEAEIETCS